MQILQDGGTRDGRRRTGGQGLQGFQLDLCHLLRLRKPFHRLLLLTLCLAERPLEQVHTFTDHIVLLAARSPSPKKEGKKKKKSHMKERKKKKKSHMIRAVMVDQATSKHNNMRT